MRVKRIRSGHRKLRSRSFSRLLILAITLPVVLILIPLVFFSLRQAPLSQAAWFDANWAYRKRVNIPSHSSLESSVYVSVPSFDATDSTKFQADCGDLRFTKENGQLLKFYVVDCDATANIHVLFDSLPAGESNYYMYYGNPTIANGFESADFSSAASGLGSLALQSEESTPGPVAYWGFNEGTGQVTQDSTANDNDATFGSSTSISTDDPVWVTNSQCVVDKCLRFDGTNDYVLATDDPTLDLGNTLTIEAWIFPNSTTIDWQGIVHKGTPSSWDARAYSLYLDQDEIAVSYKNGNGWQEFRTTTANIVTSRWTHVVYSRDSTTERIFVNGLQRAEGSVTEAMSDDTYALTIGAVTAGADGVEKFLGSIDEVKLYTYGRSATQVKSDYNQFAGKLGGQPQDTLSNGLIGYWKLDESSGNAADASGNGFTLTNANSTAYANGKYGNGIDNERGSFNYLYIADNATLSVTGALSLSAWIKPESTTAATHFNIIGKWDDTNLSYLLTQYGDEVRLFIDTDTFLVTTATSNLVTGTWYHVAGTYDPRTRIANVFVNGELAATSTGAPSAIGDTGETFLVGAAHYSFGGSDYYDGLIDEPRIYNRALSPAEIRQLYATPPSPVGYWNLDDNSGSTALDTSTRDNELTLTNTPTWKTGKYGSGIAFAGSNQHLTRADDADFDFADDADMSISLFFKHETASAQEVILSKFNEAGYKVIMESDGDITCGLDYDSTWSPTDSATSTAATYDDNTWHHVECVKLGATSLKLYIDGLLIATDSSLTATNTLTNSDPLYIGIDADGTSNDFTGSVDEIIIYNYERTYRLVNQDFNGSRTTVQNLSPSLYWAMDESSGAIAHHTGSRTDNGTVTGASFKKNGKVNGSLSMDGSGDIITGTSSPAIDGKDGITFSMWINPTSLTNSTLPTLYNRGAQSTSVGFHWIYFNVSGTLFQYQYANGSSAIQVTLGAPIVVGSWQHIAISHDRVNKVIKTYYNGRHVDTDTYSDSAAEVNTGTPYVGGYQGLSSATYGYQGYIDEFKIYQTVMSDQEIAMDFNAGSSLNLGVTAASESGQLADGAGWPPLGEWKLDEKSGTSAPDTSGNGYTATLNANFGQDRKNTGWLRGKIGNGLQFDGNNDVMQMANSIFGLVGSGSFTVETWIKVDTISAAINHRILTYQIGSGGTDGYHLALVGSSNGTCGSRVIFEIEKSNTNYTAGCSTSNPAIALNTWYHLVGVFVGASNTPSLYINGVLQTGTATMGLGLGVANTLTWGSQSSAGSNLFDGTIDHTVIYNYARTPTQILYDYNRGGPFLFYQFDECQGTAMNDVSGNTNHGTWFGTSSGSQTAVGTCNTSSTAWGNGATGKINASLNFDGTDDYVALPDDIMDTQTIGSLCSWFYYDVPTDVGTQGTLFSYSDSTGSNVKHNFFISDTGADSAAVYASLRNSTTSNQITYLSANDVVRRQTWEHICYVQDGTGVDLYINAKPVNWASTTLAGTGTLDDWFDDIATDAENATIGEIEDNSPDSWFTGKIDDFRIYSYPLTQAQILKLMQAGSAVKFGPSSGSP